MAKRQTRRTLSLSGATFATAHRHCRRNGTPLAGWVEELIRRELRAQGAQLLSHESAVEYIDQIGANRRKRVEDRESIARDYTQHFTF